MGHTILTSERLVLKEFTLKDAAFIMELMNSPGWLQYIGDRSIHSIGDAEKYLKEGPIASYTLHGFGLWKIESKSDGIPVGMCGLLQRDYLKDPDIGFAMLPAQSGRGYAKEAILATLKRAFFHMGLSRVLAVAQPDNKASISLLGKVGFEFDKKICPDQQELNLYECKCL
ncbi:MAG: GNAT family N-acetyltransferase [Cyclobacteriaceae bacterium]